MEDNRFIAELEFVQLLANPNYVGYLAKRKYLERPEFCNYLKYLSYWRHPRYLKFLRYPQCLHFLDLLQNRDFCNAISTDPIIIASSTNQIWQWRFNTQILPQSAEEFIDMMRHTKDDAMPGSPADMPVVFDPSIFKTHFLTLVVVVYKVDTDKTAAALDADPRTSRINLLYFAQIFPCEQDPEKAMVIMDDSVAEDDIEEVMNATGLEYQIDTYGVEIMYGHYDYDRAVKKLLLGTGIPPPPRFEERGHVACLDLSPELYKYRFVLGRLVVEKNPSVRTVVMTTGPPDDLGVTPIKVIYGRYALKTIIVQGSHRLSLDCERVAHVAGIETLHAELAASMLERGPIGPVAVLNCGIGTMVLPLLERGTGVKFCDANPVAVEQCLDNINECLPTVSPDLYSAAVSSPSDYLLNLFDSDSPEPVTDIVTFVRPSAPGLFVMRGLLVAELLPTVHAIVDVTGAEGRTFTERTSAIKTIATRLVRRDLELKPAEAVELVIKPLRFMGPGSYRVLVEFMLPKAFATVKRAR
ncbi:tRNA transferase Trm5/Tyw2 [Carpediemonas membranifera]|uniref:tRNA transferase Trm5/Tyw2 n=1 Tax=Carpediemonas membranifera TaxID=201153 RepID=A0A8J6AQQ5_9EUKA|nr:tRNA transferase Trm5/Tyw2 [Carpediemonas membranifera]|eukprot:KAG9389645.1 tRNA transferase Trm5/Tyw2 [Carpediemonas membranifera]